MDPEKGKKDLCEACTTPLTPEEEEKVRALLEAVGEREKEGAITPLSDHERHWLSPLTARRYLAARSWDHNEALKMVEGTLDWFKEMKPWELKCNDSMPLILKGKLYNYPDVKDREGHPIVFSKCATEELPFDEEYKLKFMFWAFERAIISMDTANTGIYKYTWLVSLEGYNRQYNGSISFNKQLLTAVCYHYPERLHKVYLVHSPWVFSLFFKALSPLLDPVTRSKIVFVSGTTEEVRQRLHEDIDMTTLEEAYFGDLPNRFNEDEYEKMCYDSDAIREKEFQNFMNPPDPEAKSDDAEKPKRKRKKKKKKKSDGLPAGAEGKEEEVE
mmetsp:Transcript_35795/g.100748  ORF Transcript_35795/g.100748 Transcript_35795/m.100748 type:complete len:329 (+) Transcript_35795:97-1083(+)